MGKEKVIGVGPRLVHLIEEPAAKNSLDEAEQKWARAYDAWEAATWAVMRDPQLGEPIAESGNIRLFTYVGARSIDMPDVTVLYETQGDTTVIIDALFKDATAAQSGRA